MRADGLLKNATFLREPGSAVPGQPKQENLIGKPQHPHERLGAQRTDDAEDDRVQEKARFISDLHESICTIVRYGVLDDTHPDCASFKARKAAVRESSEGDCQNGQQ